MTLVERSLLNCQNKPHEYKIYQSIVRHDTPIAAWLECFSIFFICFFFWTWVMSEYCLASLVSYSSSASVGSLPQHP